MKNAQKLILLEGDLESRLAGGSMVQIYSPICPDYHFKEIQDPFGETERIHDFDGLGEEMGIVYEKLIASSKELFDDLERRYIKYKHILLVADVEVEDPVILKKLGISKKEFVRRCKGTAEKIRRDGKDCLLMSDFFEQNKYDFEGNIDEILTRLKNDLLTKKVQTIRYPLHRFWFGLSREESMKRSLDEIAMYASFGHCPDISAGVILCADSEVLSRCYNVAKKGKKTPVIYISGKY